MYRQTKLSYLESFEWGQNFLNESRMIQLGLSMHPVESSKKAKE
jgi:hypothetical protein